MSAIGSYLKYDISYYGIVLCVGISTVELDTYAILSNIWGGKMAGEKKIDKSVVCVVCCKKLLSTNHDFPNGKYETCICRKIGICVDD